MANLTSPRDIELQRELIVSGVHDTPEQREARMAANPKAHDEMVASACRALDIINGVEHVDDTPCEPTMRFWASRRWWLR